MSVPRLIQIALVHLVVAQGSLSQYVVTVANDVSDDNATDPVRNVTNPTTVLPIVTVNNVTVGVTTTTSSSSSSSVVTTTHGTPTSSEDIAEIFRGLSNDSVTTPETVVAAMNVTCPDDEGIHGTNVTTGCHNDTIADTGDTFGGFAVVTAADSVAIAAGICLVSAVVGYFSCVGYRRYLQRKYGDSQRLGHDDVYDTTDLKYFEI